MTGHLAQIPPRTSADWDRPERKRCRHRRSRRLGLNTLCRLGRNRRAARDLAKQIPTASVRATSREGAVSNRSLDLASLESFAPVDALLADSVRSILYCQCRIMAAPFGLQRMVSNTVRYQSSRHFAFVQSHCIIDHIGGRL